MQSTSLLHRQCMTDLYIIRTLNQIVILTAHVHECMGRLLLPYASRLFTASEEACAQKGCHSGASTHRCSQSEQTQTTQRVHRYVSSLLPPCASRLLTAKSKQEYRDARHKCRGCRSGSKCAQGVLTAAYRVLRWTCAWRSSSSMGLSLVRWLRQEA